MASAPHLSLPLAASSSQFSKPQVYWKLVQFAALPASCRIVKISFYGSESVQQECTFRGRDCHHSQTTADEGFTKKMEAGATS
jgi:hypothetical protein